MRAIILERRGDEIAVLREDGMFARARHAGEIGETIELPETAIAFPKKNRDGWMRGAAAAMLALTLTGGTLGYMGGTASAYVSLDVGEDSAIELTINHFGRVIAVSALDESAQALAESLSGEVRHHRAEAAFDITMTRLQDEGYLDDESSSVIVGVATDNDKRASELRELAEQSIGRGGAHPAYVSALSRAEREQAKEQNISAGKFGFTRDHRGLPAQDDGIAETDTKTEQSTLPAIPANRTESGVSDAQPSQNDAQDTQEQSSQDIGQSIQERNRPPQSSERPAPEQSQPPQSSEQPAPEQSQPPQSSEQPAPEQQQPPQDGDRPAPDGHGPHR